jgi:hypothetical protein
MKIIGLCLRQGEHLPPGIPAKREDNLKGAGWAGGQGRDRAGQGPLTTVHGIADKAIIKIFNLPTCSGAIGERRQVPSTEG